MRVTFGCTNEYHTVARSVDTSAAALDAGCASAIAEAVSSAAQSPDANSSEAIRALRPAVYGSCPGYIVDHIDATETHSGADTPDNMQWQDVATAKIKDRLE